MKKSIDPYCPCCGDDLASNGTEPDDFGGYCSDECCELARQEKHDADYMVCMD